MDRSGKTKAEIIAENEELRQRIAALEAAADERPAVVRETETRYRTLVESTPDIIYIVDQEGRLLYANRTAAAYMGVDPESLVGKTQADLFPPELAELHRARIRRVFETGETGEMEEPYRIRNRDVWLNVRSIPLRDEQGQIVAMMGVCRNVTARKQAEEALAKAHADLEGKVKERTAELAVFRSFADAASQGMGMAEMEGRIVYVNQAMCRLLDEETPADMLKKRYTDYHLDDVLARRESEIIPTILRDGHWQAEVTMRSARGRLVPTLHYVFLIRDDHGQPMYLATTIVDLTEQKRAEQALRESEARFRSYFEQGLIGMAVSSADRQWIHVNDRYCEMLGYTRDELLQKRWVDLTHPDDREHNVAQHRRLLSGEIDYLTMDKRMLRKDGQVLYVTLFARCYRHDDGSVDHVLALIADITERKLAQTALERERESLWHMLQASDHERQTIAYEIHDGLAQYLAAASMQFQTFEALRKQSPHDARKAYKTAVELVRQAHFESRRLISEVRPPVIDEIGIEMAISHLVHEERRNHGPKIEFQSNVQFQRLPAILENALYRIAQEALTNACKHSHSRKVHVALVQEGRDIRLEVCDWGVGFDPDAVGKGHFGLEGIRQRVRLLGGRLSIRSAPSSGTTVEVHVPMVEQRDGPRPSELQ